MGDDKELRPLPPSIEPRGPLSHLCGLLNCECKSRFEGPSTRQAGQQTICCVRAGNAQSGVSLRSRDSVSHRAAELKDLLPPHQRLSSLLQTVHSTSGKLRRRWCCCGNTVRLKCMQQQTLQCWCWCYCSGTKQ